MSSLRHIAPATHRSGNALAGVSRAPAHQFQSDPIAVSRLLSLIRSHLAGGWQVVCLWRRRQRDRAVLRSLSLREIRDFCPSETEVEEEMNKPFWRA